MPKNLLISLGWVAVLCLVLGMFLSMLGIKDFIYYALAGMAVGLVVPHIVDKMYK